MLGAHRRLGAASQGDLCARSGSGAGRGARLRGALGEGRAARPDRRRAVDDQGEHRHPRHAGAGGHRRERARAGGERRAAGGADARVGRGDPRQDDDARLRDAVVGPVELPCAGAQPLGPEQGAGRQQRRRGRGGRGRLRAAARRHRHRRVAPPARRLVRHLHPEAEPRPDPDRPALRRPLRRADDEERRRRRAADERAGAARRARHDEPAGRGHRLVAARARRARPEDRPAARSRALACRSIPRSPPRCEPRPSASPPPAPRSRPIGPYFTRAMLDGMDAFWRMRSWLDFQALPAERRAKVLPFIARWVEGGAKLTGRRGVPRLQPDGGDARGRGRGAPTLRRRALADRADPRLRRRARLAHRRSGAAARAHLLHRRLQHERAAGREHQLRLDPRRPADRPADRRQAPRRPRRAPGRGRLGSDAARAAALARAARPPRGQ